MADDRGGPLTYEPVPSAEAIAYRKWLEVQRKEEISRRQQELLDEARRQAARQDEANPDLKGQKSHARTRRPKTVTVDDVEMPRAEAEAKIPEQMDLEERLLSSPLRERALRRSRTEELVSEGKSPAEADQIARKEQEGRASAFKLGQDTIRNSKSYQDKETRALASGLTNSAVAFGSRVLGFNQTADEAEAASAGLSSEMARVREERHPYPRIQGALAGAAANSIQMLPGMVAAPITGPGVGLALMSGQYGTQEYSRAAYEGAEAGLAGDELDRYALTQASIEAAVMPIFSKIPGMGGLEGRVLRSAFAKNVASHPSVRKAMASGVKFTKDTGAELAEELTTEALHGLATEKLLDQDVDYKAILTDTVLQTLLLMGASEAGQQAGRLVPSSEQRIPGDRPQQTAPETPALVQPQQQQEYETPVLRNPAIDAFIAKPESAKTYEAAVAAGMAPLPNPNRKERAKYAAELQKSQEVAAPVAIEPTAPMEAPPATVADDYARQFEEFLLNGANNEGQETEGTQGNQVTGNEGAQGQEGRQEGLLIPPAGTQESGEMSFEEALAIVQRAAQATPDEVEKSKTPPLRDGGASPDQPQPSVAGPVSSDKSEPPVKKGMVRVYHSGSQGEGDGGRWVSTNKAYASGYRPHLPLFFTDIPETDTRVNNPDYPEEGLKRGHTFNFDLTPDEAQGLREIDRVPEETPVATGVPSPDQPATEAGPVSNLASHDWSKPFIPRATQAYLDAKKSGPEAFAKYLDGRKSLEVLAEARHADGHRRQKQFKNLTELGDKTLEEHIRKPGSSLDSVPDLPYAEDRGRKSAKNSLKPGEIVSIGYLDGSEALARLETKDGKKQSFRMLTKAAGQSEFMRPGSVFHIHADDNNLMFGMMKPKEVAGMNVPPLGASKQEWSDFADGTYKPSPETPAADSGPVSKPPVSAFAALPQKSQDLFNKAFESNDVDSLKQMVDKNNLAWNAEWESRTGNKLPRSLKARHQAVLDWVGPQATPEPTVKDTPQPFGQQIQSLVDEIHETLPQEKQRDKVLISHIWQQYKQKNPQATRDQFNADMLEAHRSGHISMSRRDLQGDATKEEIRESLISPLPGVLDDAAFHVVKTSKHAGKLKPASQKQSEPPADKRFPPLGRSLRSIVLSEGGIKAKSLRKDYSQKDLKSDGLLGIMRISGLPLDVMAQTLEASGALRTPQGRSPADWLIEQLKANADSANAQYTDAEIAAQLESEREAYERVKDFEEAGLEELRKRSEEAGVHAADAKESGEGELSDAELEVIDTSFDFGANVKAPVADEDAFTLKRPEKPKPKPTDFGTAENTKQGGLFDAGKKGDLPGQELLFNSDPGDLQNPKTQENKAKPTESDIKAAMRAELSRQEADDVADKEPKATKPAKPPKEKPPAAPRPPRTATGEKLGKLSEKTGKAAKQAWNDFLEEAGDLGVLSVVNNKALVATAKMVRAQIADGVVKFADLVERIVSYSSPATARKLSDYLEAAWEILGETNSKLDPAGKVADVLGPETGSTPAKGWSAIPGHFVEQLLKGERYTSISEARREAGDIIGQPVTPGTAEAKQLDEAIEYGIVQAGRSIVSEGGTPAEIYDRLVNLYERQPVLGVRDSNSMEMQAYSTPVPLAWLVSTLGHVTPQTRVYEPTAGNGMLLIGTDVKNAFANELDPKRAQTLRDQGFNVTQSDAATATSPKVQAVLANPPFGKVKDADRKNIEFDVDGFKTTEIDHAIALQSLKGMEQDGYTVLILAAKGHNVKTDLERRMAYSKGKDRPFYDALYQGYDVASHFTVDGSLYSRQGASFPVDVIVLRPLGTLRADEKRSTPWAIVPRMFSTWQEIRDAHFNKDMADSGAGTGVSTGIRDNGSSTLSTGNTDDVGRVPGQNENTAPVAEGDVGPAEPESVVSTPVDGEGRSGRSGTKSGGSRSQSGLSRPAATERSGKGNVSNASEAGSVGKGLNSGTGPDGLAATGAAESEVDPESHQSAYEPSSKNKTVETLVPTNLQDAIRTALDTVEDTYGPIDAFVQKELGYEPNDKFFNDLSAEQVDAIALAIHSHKSGAGMVVGDMTGVGKGRVAAAMMRYAERQGLVPVFVTEKPDLFGDMYRDLADIGSDTPGAPFFAQPTNDTAGSKAIDLPDGRKLQSSKETAGARIDEALASLKAGNGFTAMVDGVPTKINAVFTMYSQLQTVKGEETRRRQQLRDLMPHAFLIMDESHNAGGTVKERVNENAPPDRAALARELVQASAGTMYLSATFAKRPDVMDLYSKTDMAKAVDGDITKLSGVLQTGGLPLQQVLSAMLSESGQYIRREKSFEGIEFAKVDVGVDLGEQDKITDVFRGIRTLDGVINEIVTGMNDALVAAGEHGVAGDVSTGDAGMTSNSFSSILWNAVDQMLFALKADKAADNAIEAWQNGETPILAVDNTMEGIIDEYVEENGLKVGDVVNLNFRHILHRYLERSRWITIDTGMRDARGKKITRKERLTDDQLNVETAIGNALTMFNDAYAAIEATDINAPASPIDWLRFRMQKAGMKIAEITGRKTILVYSENGVATLGARPKAEKGTRGKQETIRRINDGSLDGLILNRSGATGVSIHASSKFKNQKARHMMIVQSAKNIDEFMQMLGRVNRTGQVVKPRYSLMMSDSPAELRPAAVLSKKLASLNASVTAKSKGAVGFDVVDVMNEVGGAIISQYLYDNQDFALSLDMTIEEMNDDAESDSLEDVARKATGRSSILPIAQQREFWDDITAAYNMRIEELNAFNANPLIAQTMDLDAKTLSTINVFAGEPDGGPFAAPADIVRMDVKNPGKPMTASQVTGRIMEFYGISSMDDRHDAAVKWERETVDSLRDEMPDFKVTAVARLVNPEAVAARHAKLDEQTEEVIRAIQDFSPGTVVDYAGDGMFAMRGVVIGFRRTGKTGNPAAPSRWMIEVAVNDSAKKINVPVSQIRGLSGRMESMDSLLGEFETMQTRSREKRWMGTGNLVAAYAKLAAQNGKLVFYTDDQGNTRRGIIMPRAFDAAAFLEQQPVQFTSTDDILRYFEHGGERLVSADHELIVVKSGNGVNLWAPRARSRGGKYTLNPGILAAAGRDFVSVGNRMNLFVSDSDTKRRVIDAILELTTLEASGNDARILAREILGLNTTGQPIQPDSEEAPATVEPLSAEAPSELRNAADKAKQELRELQLLKAQYDKVISKEWQRAIRDSPASGFALTDEMARAIAGRVVVTIKTGVKRFEVFVRDLRANLSEDAVRGMKPTIIATWNILREKHDLNEATDVLFDIAMNDTKDVDVELATAAAKASVPAAAEPPAGTPDPAALKPAAERTYSTKNAFSAAERERLDMGERPPVERQSREESIERAKAIGQTKYGSNRIDELIQELIARPRAVTPEENDLLNYRNAELGEKLESALRRQNAAHQSGDDAQEVISATLARNLIAEKRTLISEVLEPIGTAAGRALQARKAVIDQDFTMVRQALLFEAAHGRAPNPDELAAMQKQIDDLNSEVAELQKQLDAQEAENTDLQTKLKEAHNAAVAQPAPAEPKKESVLERLAKEGKERAERGFKKLSGLKGKVFSLEAAAADVAEALFDIATGYAQQGVTNLADFLNRLRKRMGPDAEEFISVATEQWNKLNATATESEVERITRRIDPTDEETIGRVARDLHRFVIQRDDLDASADGREAAVDAVYQILRDLVPDLTIDQTARAMSGIGVYSPLSDDAIEAIRRDQKAQLLLLEQIADWTSGQAPPATGQERPPVSDEQRALRKLVNDAKKAAGIVTATEGQLRSALDAAKRLAQNRITDLTKAIETGQRIAVSRKLLTPDSELTALREERDALQKLYDAAFGKRELSEEQRMNAAERALDRAISDLEADLKAGKLYPDAPKSRLTSPAIEAKRASLAALKALRDEMRIDSGEAEARSDAAYKRHLLDRDAELARRLRDKDFAPAAKKKARILTPSMLKLMQSIDKQQKAIRKERNDWEFKNRHEIYKFIMKGPVAGLHMLRKGLTTVDQSLIGRQGMLLGATHPKIYAKAIRKAFGSKMFFPSEEDLFKTQADLDADPNWVRLEKIAKLAVTDVHGGLTAEEGNMHVPEWFDKIPGVGASERAGSAFINTQRRLVFRSLVEKLATDLDGKRSITNAELRVIGNGVNVASGRGSLGRYANSLEALTLAFFSPRWWMSRLQWWAGQPVWHDSKWFGGEGASKEVRMMMAKEWVAQASAQAAIMGLAILGLTAAFGDPGDDEEWDWYGNPKNANFGKIRIGNTYVDMTAGLGQHVSLLARLASGKEIKRWEGEQDVDALRLLGQHERGKLAPVPSMVVDYFAGKSVDQKEFGSPEWWMSRVAPLIGQDVVEAVREEGPATGAALSMLMFFGIGANTRERKSKERSDVANELRAMKNQNQPPEKIQQVLDKHLKHAAQLEAKEDLRTADPEEVAALEKVIAGDASPELSEAIQKEKFDVTLRAIEMLSSEDRKAEKNPDDDKGIGTARMILKTIAPTFEEANAMFGEAYKQRNGSLVEVVGGQFRAKRSVVAARRRLQAIYDAK